MEINTTNSPATNDLLVVTGDPLTLGGTLTVTNTGPALVGGEQFDLFDASTITPAFSGTNLPALDSGLNWWLGQLGSDGKIIVNRAATANDQTYTRGANASFDSLVSAGTQGATL